MFEDIILSAVITGISVFIGSYVMLQLTMRKLKKNIKVEAIAWLNTTEAQQIIYKLGVLVGSGARQGIGLTKGSGKLSLEGIVTQAIGGFINNKFGGVASPETQSLSKQTDSMNIE